MSNSLPALTINSVLSVGNGHQMDRNSLSVQAVKMFMLDASIINKTFGQESCLSLKTKVLLIQALVL